MKLYPGAPLRCLNDWEGGGVNRSSYFTPKNTPTSAFVYPKKSHTNSKLRLRYCWHELMKSTKKIPVFLS